MQTAGHGGVYGFIAAGRSYLVYQEDGMGRVSDAPLELLAECIDGVIRFGGQYGQHVRQRLRDQCFWKTTAYDSDPGSAPIPEKYPSVDFFTQFVESHPRCFKSAVSWLLESRTLPNALETVDRDLKPIAPGLESLLSSPVVPLIRPERWGGLQVAVVVDLDSDAVAILKPVGYDTYQQKDTWGVRSCASLSSLDDLHDMANDVRDPAFFRYDTTNDRRRPNSTMYVTSGAHRYYQEQMDLPYEEARWRKAVTRFQRLEGSVLRSFDTARCGANLGRPQGWPTLLDEDAYPTDEDVSRLAWRHLFPDERPSWLAEEQHVAADEGPGVPGETLDELSSGLNALDATDIGAPSAVATRKRGLTDQQRQAILFWKGLELYPNRWIANKVGATEGQVQRLTRGMPKVAPRSFYHRQQRMMRR